ncbi:hypothetical protein NL676_007981 [Syzygium grande]|nr:hypothetical protein NL676_007981 [Syzygium grande]
MEANRRASTATIATFTWPLLGIVRLMTLLAILLPPTLLIFNLFEPAVPSVLSLKFFWTRVSLSYDGIESVGRLTNLALPTVTLRGALSNLFCRVLTF